MIENIKFQIQIPQTIIIELSLKINKNNLKKNLKNPIRMKKCFSKIRLYKIFFRFLKRKLLNEKIFKIKIV